MTKDNLVQQIMEVRQNRIQSFAFIIAASMAVCISIYFVVSGLSKLSQNRDIQLDERINPNDASVASLVRLPGIGIIRAEAIVAYRKDFVRQKGSVTFQDCNDLQKVRGIGPKTVQNISPWLKFE